METKKKETGEVVQTAREIIRKAEEGDRQAIQKVKDLVRDEKFRDILGGNLVKDTRQTIIATHYGPKSVAHYALEQQMECMRKELMGPN